MWLSLLDYFFVWRAYLRSEELYNSIKIRVMASKHRNEIQVIQLLARCICVIHFIVKRQIFRELYYFLFRRLIQ